MNKIIETFDLTKIYQIKGQQKELRALNNVNLSIKEGEIFGLLGPNGAGKTTIIHILSTIKQPTSGYVLINGHNIIKKPIQAKSNIALMLESKMLYRRLTAYSNLKFFCKIYKVTNYKEKILEKVKEFGLEKWLNQYVENFSSGMQMKLALCRTLLLDRNILILDEPTLGLDVKSKSLIVDTLKQLNKTIFLTSHDMGVVEKLCDKVAFINKGNILKIGTKNDVKKLKEGEVIVEIGISKNQNIKNELKQQSFINSISQNNDKLVVSLKNKKYYKDLFSILRKYDVFKINEVETSLEDLFLKFSN